MDPTISARVRASSDTRQTAQVTGVDASEVFTVHLDVHGHPERIDVAPQWKAQLRPEALSDACTEALLDALDRRVDLLEKQGEAAPHEPIQAAERPRSLEELLHEVTSFDIGAVSKQLEDGFAPPDEDAVDAAAPVAIVLSGGLWRAIIEPQWASSQNSSQLAAQLQIALQAAQEPTPPQGWALARRLMAQQDQLFAEALAHLQNLGADQ